MMTEPDAIKLLTPIDEQDHILGPPSAAVTFLQYGDFECPDCGRAYPVVKEIQRRLGHQLRFVFRHFPLYRVHPRAGRAAEATEAAAAQGKFWEMHDALFKNQHALEEHHLAQYAKQVGLDVARFNREMAENLYAARVNEQYTRALYVDGITGTPTFYINGLRFNDTLDLERLLSAIRRAEQNSTPPAT